jgi:short chain enoyl-CoA hydratase (EC 4.2.1.17)
MPYETIIYERLGSIALITLNRPEAMNAINSQLWCEMGNLLEEIENDNEIHIIVLTGSGDRAFCAGMDLKELASGKFRITDEMAKWGFAGIAKHFISKPIIAAVNGLAIGGGLEIMLACDLIVASDQSKFALPEVKRGIIAAGGGLLRIARQIPEKIAMKLVLTGDVFEAKDALQWGLVNEVVAPEKVLDTAMELANKICENAPIAVQFSKRVLYESMDTSLNFPENAWSINDLYTKKIFATEDSKEGPKAFAEKRKPVWTGK